MISDDIFVSWDFISYLDEETDTMYTDVMLIISGAEENIIPVTIITGEINHIDDIVMYGFR